MAWAIFMLFAFTVPLVNGDDNTDVVQMTLHQSIDKKLDEMADHLRNTPIENWQKEANQFVSETNRQLETIVGDRPRHHSNHAKKKFTKAELNAGREFLNQANHSSLYLEAKKTIHGYMSAATAFLAGKNRNASNVTDDELLTYKEPWCKELRLAYGRTICDDAYGFTLSNAWFHTKCLLEACVDGNDTHPPCLGEKGATRLMILVEVYDALMKQMPLLLDHLKTGEVVDFEKPEFCPGEEDVFLLKVKQHQNNMLARHHQIQQAMAHTKAVAEGLATSSMASNDEHAEDSIQRVWEDICGHLKCDHGSWVDIHDTMHGHVVDLSEEGMPVRILIEHVRSLRKTHDALVDSFQKFVVPELDNFTKSNATARPHAVSLYQMFSKESTGEKGSARYEALGKDLLAVADAAYALKHGSTVHLTWFPFCWKVFSGASVGYKFPEKMINPPNPFPTFTFGINFNCGGAIDIWKVFDSIFDGKFYDGLAGVSCKLSASFSINMNVWNTGPGLATVIHVTDFLPAARPISVAVKVGVVATLATSWGTPDGLPECVIGKWLLGLAECKYTLVVGVGFVCIDLGIFPDRDADAAKDMPMGETSKGRDCTGNGWGGNSGWNGKSYMWCYTESGGWDYTCPVTDPQLHVSKTTRNENCYKPCAFHGYKYKWCYKDQSDRWDYCCMPGQGSAQTSGQNSRLLESP
jgi:hypothetical protein